ncbi:MAG: integrin alpha [Myxococcota bacterium]|nr:integrin alpha [Myxococcota bacterium]
MNPVRIVALLGIALAGLSTGCPDKTTYFIRIQNPQNGHVFRPADDRSPESSGVQIRVVAVLGGFAQGRTVRLTVNDNPAHGMDRRYDGSGVVDFDDVTIDVGTNTIAVSVDEVHDTVRVTLEGGDPCPRISFARPTAGAALQAVDDADGDPINGLQYDVRVGTTAADGTAVDLAVDGTPAGTASVSGGAAFFPGATLVSPMPAAAVTVQIRASTSAACTATISVRIVPTEPCPALAFTEPLDGAVFGADGDIDGDPDNGFQRNVVVATNARTGTEVELYVAGSLGATTRSDGLVARFERVTLTEGAVALRAQTRPECSASIGVTVRTGAPTCSIVHPVGPDLNAADDSNPATRPDFETGVEVSSNAEDGERVALIVDRVEQATAALAAGRALFADVSLAQGTRTLQARCRNRLGNVGFSPVATYRVDSIVPTVEIEAPADGAWFNDVDHDALPGVPETQVEVSIRATDSPTTATVSLCGYAPLDPEGLVVLDGAGRGRGHVTLTGPGNEVCADVADAVGNTARARITLNLDTDAPRFEIRRPAPATTLILAADDEGPSDTLCQYTVEVGCSNVGQPVTLYVNTIARPTATCTGSPDDLGGTARWPAIVLPQGGVTLRADGRTIGDLYGSSPNKTVTVDTEPPVLAIAVPACGRIFTPADDVSGTIADGVQIRVEVRTSDPAPVTLDVTDSGGASLPGSPYLGTPAGAYAVYPSVTVVPGGTTFGTAFLAATATDVHGQVGRSTPSPCSVVVRDVPRVRITSPAGGAVLGPADDCDPGAPGFQLGVTVETNITAGTVELFVAGPIAGSQPYTGTPVTFCVPAPDGTNIVVRAEGTDIRGTGSSEIRVAIDSRPPDVPITDLAIVVNARRGGVLDLNWTAPSDAGGGRVAGYRIRCLAAASAATPFVWDTALPYFFTGSVGDPGAPQSQRLTGFRIERYVTCMVRAADAPGSLGPPGNTPQVRLEFLRAEILGEAGTTMRFGFDVEPLGDINGDGRSDFAVGTMVGDSAYLFFGSATGVPTAWGTVITGEGGSNFGYALAGPGDFDGDTIGDLVIGAFNAGAGRGRAYLFLGRTSWPPVMTVADADLTVVVDDPSSTADDTANLGFDVAGIGDFDGDTLRDVLIGARGWNAYAGAGFLLFGRRTPTGTLEVPGDRLTGFAGDLWLAAGPVGTEFTASIAGGVTINGDGYADLVTSAPYGASGGAVYVLLGRTRPAPTGLTTVSAYDHQILSPAAGISVNFGLEVSLALLDRNTSPDLLVGMDRPPGALSLQGGVLTFLNSGGGFPSSASGMIQNDSSAPTNDRFGWFLPTGWAGVTPALSDLDGDGLTDVLVGMGQLGTAGGAGQLFFGRDYATTVLSSTADLTVEADAGDTTSRGVVGYLGDVNADTFPDLAVAHTRHATDRGRLLVLY